MDRTDYRRLIDEISRYDIRDCDNEFLTTLQSRNPDLARALIDYAVSVLTPAEVEYFGEVLSIGFFGDLDRMRGIACHKICHDAAAVRERRELSALCCKYDKSQEPFVSNPSLADALHNDDLVCLGALVCNGQNHIFIHQGMYGLLEPRLPQYFLDWACNEFKGKKVYVRIRAQALTPRPSPEPVVEAVTILRDPCWWKNLSLRPGQDTGSSFELFDEKLCPDNRQRYWEYNAKHVRRLEYHARKDNTRNPEYLSMMLEELILHEDKARPERTFIEGRMIHLDTAAKYGQPFGTARLMHIDIALNYYFDEAAGQRLAQNLANGGKTVDATMRTHLFRVDDVAMMWLFRFAYAFFKSGTLLDEWVKYQFAGMNYSV